MDLLSRLNLYVQRKYRSDLRFDIKPDHPHLLASSSRPSTFSGSLAVSGLLPVSSQHHSSIRECRLALCRAFVALNFGGDLPHLDPTPCPVLSLNLDDDRSSKLLLMILQICEIPKPVSEIRSMLERLDFVVSKHHLLGFLHALRVKGHLHAVNFDRSPWIADTAPFFATAPSSTLSF
jgi:hypothetical protein